MSEKYGVYARLIDSIASTPVDASTNILFIGAAPIHKVEGYENLNLVNTPIRISSMTEFEQKLGGVEEGFNLSDAALAAFEIVGISHVWMINVFDDDLMSIEDDLDADAFYLGNAAEMTGIYAAQKLWPEQGVTPDVICCPGRQSPQIANAIQAIGTKINGHFDCYGVYDVTQSAGQVSNGMAVIGEVTKQLSKESCTAVWGDVISPSKRIVAGSAVVACLYASNDAKQAGNIPVRSIGNTPVSIVGMSVDGSESSVHLSESDATQLSADGIVTFLNQGGGTWTTWGDHTSAMNKGSVTDERARYDSNMRVLYHLANRFQKKYRFSIDKPMTLQMRNDIINEETNYLTYMQSVGAIIGEAKCEFRPDVNPQDNIAQGQFVWSIEATVTPPMKYAELQVAFSQAGYSVYYK